MPNEVQILWKAQDVQSPTLDEPVPVISALGIPYAQNAHRFQTLSIYLPRTERTAALVDTPAASLPIPPSPSSGPGPSPSAPPLPRYQIHIHGGAWRDPNLTSRSIEPAVAHAFSKTSDSASTSGLDAIISLNYTLSPFPTHPTQPYDATSAAGAKDPSRSAAHPGHVRDVLRALSFLRRAHGVGDGSYVLSAHSAGACLAAQAVLGAPGRWGYSHGEEEEEGEESERVIPRPAALLGLNGLYDLPALVHGLGESHAWLAGEYRMLIGHAFGQEEEKKAGDGMGGWVGASPALGAFETEELAGRVKGGSAVGLVVLDQSAEDQLVPMNQVERFEKRLREVQGLRVVRANLLTGLHAAPWEKGDMLWDSVRNVLNLLKGGDHL